MKQGSCSTQCRIWSNVARRSNLIASQPRVGHRAAQQASDSLHDPAPSVNATIFAPHGILASSALSAFLKFSHRLSCGCATQQVSQKYRDELPPVNRVGLSNSFLNAELRLLLRSINACASFVGICASIAACSGAWKSTDKVYFEVVRASSVHPRYFARAKNLRDCSRGIRLVDR